MTTRKEVVSRLKKIHDEIKVHPFRDNFAAEYISDYKHLLYQMTVIWNEWIYDGTDQTEEEITLLRQFGGWIHNYRQELRTYLKDSFPMQYFDYYEQMLQITHIFIDTGIFNVFYNIDCFFDEKNTRIYKVEKYELITQEMCGINSPILPRYFPVNMTLETNEDVIKDYIKNKGYPYYKWEEEKQDELFERWKKDVKPILEWINSKHEETKLKHKAWLSVHVIS